MHNCVVKSNYYIFKGQFVAPPPGAGGMGRGYGGYSAMTPGYPGAPNMVSAGYGYGKSSYSTIFTCFLNSGS